MRNFIDIGSAPPMESCAQVGSNGYWPRAQRECKAFIGLLRRALGPEPDGAELRVKSNPHDFGTYLSVVCFYEPSNQPAIDYAFRCESQGPENWDEQALVELAQPERSSP